MWTCDYDSTEVGGSAIKLFPVSVNKFKVTQTALYKRLLVKKLTCYVLSVPFVLFR